MPMPFNERVSEKNRRVLSAVLLAHICKRFAKAQGPCTILQLKKETDLPAHVIAELLAGLLETKMIVNVTGSDKDRLPAYMPGEDIANITVGEMVDRLDDVGAWPMIDDELKKAIGEKTLWGQAFQIRKNYIDQLRTLKVSDLEISGRQRCSALSARC